MAERYVYIDAPTLDNSDRCSFLVNDNLGFAIAGEGEDAAQFALYNKFLASGEVNHMIDLSDLMRTNFIPGLVASNSESTSIGGDYAIGNTCKIFAKNLKVGRLLGFKFRLYEKSEITASNRVDTFTHSIVSSYLSAAPRIAIYAPTFNDDGTVASSWNRVAYAAYVSRDADGNGIYMIEGQGFIEIPGKWLTTNNCSLVISFLNSSDGEGVESGNFNNGNFRIPNGHTVGLRGLPRPSTDNSSYICYKAGTSGARDSGESRLLDFDYIIDTDLVEEFIGSNSENHHLNIADVKDLNSLRYSAPAILADLSYSKKIGTTDWNSLSYIKISDKTITRNGRFNLLNVPINSIQIPFTYGENNDLYINSDYGNKGDITSGNGIANTNRKLLIAFETDDEGNPQWIESDNSLCFSYFPGTLTYTFTFKTTDIDSLKYKGKGIWIAARPPAGENGVSNLAFNIWYKTENGNDKFWAYAESSATQITDEDDCDYIDFSTSLRKNATPNIKVMFSYFNRSEWFDYIESLALGR